MSIFSAFGGGKIQSVEEAFQQKDITSPEMKKAIRDWLALYLEGDAPKEEDDCQRLPVLVVNKLCKTVFSEYEATVTGGKQEFFAPILNRAESVRKKAIQYAFVGGECFLKPIRLGNSFDFVVIRRDNFIPFARDVHGRIVCVATCEQSVQNGFYYTLVERRTLQQNGDLLIEYRLFRSTDKAMLGVETSLSALPQYEALAPEILLRGIGNLGMVQLKTPLLNCVDGSDDGVSVYAPAVGLIKNINRNEQQLNREFENGRSRVICSADMLTQDGSGKKQLTDDLFVGVEDNPETTGITVFSPALREASYLARKQEYLRNIESLIGMKRGILSEVETVEKTATEITSSAGDYNLTIQDFQECWETALRELLVTCDKLAQAYNLGGGGFDPETDLTVDWGDGVLFDRTRTWNEYQSMVSAGLLKPELALAWYFDLPHDTPEDLARIREDYMPELTETEE